MGSVSMTLSLNQLQSDFLTAITPPCLRPNSLSKQVKKLAAKEAPEWNPARQKLVLETLASNQFSSCKTALRKICRSLEPSQLHQLIKASAKIDPAEEATIHTPLAFKRLSDLLTLQQIEAAIMTEYPTFESALKAAKDLSSYGKYYLDIKHPEKVSSIINEILNTIIWGIELAIDTLLESFGINELLNDSERAFDSHARLQSTLQIIAAISAMVAIGATLTGSAVIGGVLAGIGFITACAALGLYLKFLKPAPRTIKGCENLTALAAAGKIDAVEGRQRYIDMVAAAIISGMEKPKTHPLLIGPSGVGKTEIIKGFAKCVADGRYPKLVGKQVFSINMAELAVEKRNNLGQSFDLESIKKKIKHRSKDVILFLDELHESAKGSNNGNLAERVKTLLDDQDCIGSTTAKEYAQHILTNPALARRFKIIPIDPLNRDQTLAVMNNSVLKERYLITTSEVIEYVYDRTLKAFPDKPQPFMSSRILRQAINQAKEVETTRLTLEIEQREAAIDKNLSSGLLESYSTLLAHDAQQKARAEENTRLYTEIEELKVKLVREKAHQAVVQEMIEKMDMQKENLSRLLKTINAKAANKKDVSRELKAFALKTTYLNQAGQELLKAYAQLNSNKLPTIDTGLIDKVIEDELKLISAEEEMLKNVPKNA